MGPVNQILNSLQHHLEFLRKQFDKKVLKRESYYRKQSKKDQYEGNKSCTFQSCAWCAV